MSIPEGYAKLAVIGIAWKGEYAADSVYHKMNGVCYEGSTYIALKDNPSGPPAHDGTNWQYLAKGFAEALMSACTATDTQGLVVAAGETTNAQTLMDSIADKVVALDAPTFEDYTGDGATVPSAETALAALKSKIKLPVWMSNVVAFCKGCCTLAMIVDNCVTDNTGLPLSAAQGKVLMDMLNQLNSRYLNNAGAHNAICRGKNLGTSVTTTQYNAIKAGTFDDLYIGDYWVINDVTWRIAAFDYYLRCGDSDLTTHHAVIVPDSSLYNHVMNDTNTTNGGYVGSKMYREGLKSAKTTIKAAFSGHVLSHRIYLTNAVANGKPSASAWCDSEADLMCEEMVYGGGIFRPTSDGSTVPANYRVEKSQLPLFAHRPDLISNRTTYWLRDVVTAAGFAFVFRDGLAHYYDANSSHGVRPAFCIC